MAAKVREWRKRAAGFELQNRGARLRRTSRYVPAGGFVRLDQRVPSSSLAAIYGRTAQRSMRTAPGFPRDFPARLILVHNMPAAFTPYACSGRFTCDSCKERTQRILHRHVLICPRWTASSLRRPPNPAWTALGAHRCYPAHIDVTLNLALCRLPDIAGVLTAWLRRSQRGQSHQGRWRAGPRSRRCTSVIFGMPAEHQAVCRSRAGIDDILCSDRKTRPWHLAARLLR